MNDLWKLIQTEAEAIAGYYDFLKTSFAQEPEAAPVVATIQRIISDERDHLNALYQLYETLSEDKAATATVEFARKAVAKHNARKTLAEYREKDAN